MAKAQRRFITMSQWYRVTPLREMVHLELENVVPITTGAAVYPEGMKWRITDKRQNSLSLRGKPCKCCKVEPRVARCSPEDFSIIKTDA